MPLNKQRFTETARDRIKNAKKFWSGWRKTAVDDYAFIAGNQWRPEDLPPDDEQRPSVTFNYSEKMIDAVVGAEVSNRNEVTYTARSMTTAEQAEMWNHGAKWVRNECQAEDEESDAFRDMLICGLGWTETRVGYDEDHDGKLYKDRIDPLEMYTDPAASKCGLSDRKFTFREYWVLESDAKAEWPATFLESTVDDPDHASGVVRQGRTYTDELMDDGQQERHKGQVPIICYECVEREPFHRVAFGGKIHEMTTSEYADHKDLMDEGDIPAVKQYRLTYYRAYFSGETMLEVNPSPCQDGFTYQPITGKRDRNKNIWYGLTRVMKDPQRWANKWLSQIMHIINTNAKGGLLAEMNAFQDPKKAAEDWSKSDSIVMLREGGIEKIKEKQMSSYPAGLDKLMQFALGSLPMVTGINLEALGLANREQAGVLESQRKQAAYGLLSPYFAGLRHYRIAEGRVLLWMMNQYIADGRMINIGGPEMAQTVALTKAQGKLHYDIGVDQSQTAPDVKEQTWQALVQLVPALLKAGMAVPPDVLDYAPIPMALAAKWKQFIQQNASVMKPEEAQKLQEENQQLKQENQQIKADKTAEYEKIKAEIQALFAKLELEKQKMAATIQIKQQDAEIKNQIVAQQGQQQLSQDAEQHDQQMEMQRQQGEQQVDLAQQTADNQHEVAMKKASVRPSPAKGK